MHPPAEATLLGTGLCELLSHTNPAVHAAVMQASAHGHSRLERKHRGSPAESLPPEAVLAQHQPHLRAGPQKGPAGKAEHSTAHYLSCPGHWQPSHPPPPAEALLSGLWCFSISQASYKIADKHAVLHVQRQVPLTPASPCSNPQLSSLHVQIIACRLHEQPTKQSFIVTQHADTTP